MFLTGPTYPIANRLAKNELLVELDLWAKHFNEDPACLETVCIFFIILWLFVVTDV